jgi:hypothetical protein
MLILEKRFVKSTELKPRAFESMAPRAMFESKREEVTGGWEKLHNEEIHNLYSSRDPVKIITPKRMRWAWHAVIFRTMKSKWGQGK